MTAHTRRNEWKVHLWGTTLALLIALIAGCAGTTTPTPMEKADVQSTMNAYIQTKLSSEGGTYDIEGVKSQFDYLHEGVDQKGDIYISCADFKSGNDVYDVDYYVDYVNGQLMVVKEVLHKKNGTKVNRTLWEN